MVNAAYSGAATSMVTFGDRVGAFLALPETGTGPFPAVILGHERYGLVQHTLDLTAKLAAHGFAGIAPDMFSRWDGDKDALNRANEGAFPPDRVIWKLQSDIAPDYDFTKKVRLA